MRGINHAEDFGWAAAPRKGGGSGGGNTTTTQSGPPPQVLANYQQVYGQAQGVAQQPYPTYDGSLIAGFTPQQQAGFNDVNTAINAGTPFLNSASQYASNATSMLDPSNFRSTQSAYMDPAIAGFSPQNFGSTVGNYYNPYAQSVIAPTQALFNEQNAEQLNQVRGNAASAGAFGGDREAVAEAETARQQQLAQAPVLAGLQSSGYDKAVQSALAAGNLQQSGFNAATGAAQGNAWLNSQGAFSMGQLGQEAQNLGLAGANAEISAGGQQQQMAQQELNLPYQQFLAAQGYPYQATNWLEGMATGTGGLSGTMGSATSPGPSALSQVAGLGLTGAGLIGQTGGFGSNGWLSGAFGGGGMASGAELAGLSASADAALAGGAADAGIGAGSAIGGAALGLIKRGGSVTESNLLHRPRGGRIPGLAPGGPVHLPNAPAFASEAGIPDVSLSVIPQPPPGPGLMGNTGSTTTSSGGGGDGGASAAMGAIADVAMLAMLAKRGGRIEDLRGLRGFEVPARRRDDGGAVAPAGPNTAAMFSGNPMMSNLYSMYTRLPTEKLRELSARMPQNQIISRALQSRQMMPQNDPAMAPAPQPGLGGAQMQSAPGGYAEGGRMPGFADGGSPDMDLSNAGSSWTDDLPVPGGDVGAMPDVGGGVPMAGFAVPRIPMPPQRRPMRDTGEPLPVPPIPPSDQDAPAAPVAGFGAHGTHGQDGQAGLTSGPWGTLLATGLGILGGTSPYAGVNIGKGGLAGLQFAEQQRQRDEMMKYRMANADSLSAYRQGTLDTRERGQDLRHQDTQDRINNQLQLAMVRAVNHAGGHATEGDLTSSAAHALMQQENPATPGKNWTYPDALLHARGMDWKQAVAERRLDQGDVRIDQGQQRIDQAVLAAQNTQEYRQKTFELRRMGLDEQTTNNVMNNATRDIVMNGGKLDDKVAAQLRSRGNIPQGGGASSVPAPSAPAQPADPLGIR